MGDIHPWLGPLCYRDLFTLYRARQDCLPDGDSENQVREVGTNGIGKMTGMGATPGRVKGQKEETKGPWDREGSLPARRPRGEWVLGRRGPLEGEEAVRSKHLGSQWTGNSMARNLGDGSCSGKEPKLPLDPKAPLGGLQEWAH